MRIRIALLALPLLASTLAAQRTTRRVFFSDDQNRPAMLQSVTIDVADAVQDRYAATIEPLVFGRFSIGLSGEYATSRYGDNPYGYPYPVDACPVNRLCTPSTYPPAPDAPHFREWSFAVHGRWYPEALTRANPRQSISAYVGEFVGYRQRRSTETIYYPCAACAAPAPDSGITYPPTPYPGGSTTNTTAASAWEPGVEAGVRVVAARHLVIDVGGNFRVVRLDDFQSSVRRGDIDSRLSLSIGFGW